MSRARIGVIGAGFWASYQYLPFYRDHPDVELVGAVRKDEQGLDSFREEFGLELATSSVAEHAEAQYMLARILARHGARVEAVKALTVAVTLRSQPFARLAENEADFAALRGG